MNYLLYYRVMIVQKFEKNQKKQLALELASRDPSISQKDLAIKLGVDATTINRWFKDPEFIDGIYDNFMILAGKHLPSVVMALINEAREGNVRAAELVLKHFNKLQDRVHIEINAPFMQFMNNKQIDDAEIVPEDAKMLADIYYKKGYTSVEAKSGVHHGTYKVFVNFVPIADITQIDESFYHYLNCNDIFKLKNLLQFF